MKTQRKAIEHFNPMNGTKIGEFSAPSAITCCDFSPVQKIFAVGFADGKVRVVDSATFKLKGVLHYDPKQLQSVTVTSVNSRLLGKIVVGYSNGIAKEFRLGESAPFNVFLTVDLIKEASDVPSSNENLPVFQIEVAEHEGIVFVAQNDPKNGKAIVRTYQSGSSASKTSIATDFTGSSIRVFERYKALAVLSTGVRISIYNYTDGECLVGFDLNIPGVTDVPHNGISSSWVLSYTKQLQKVYENGEKPDESPQKGDLVYIGFGMGQILGARLEITLVESRIQCTLLPYNLYKVGGTKVGEQKATEVSHLFVDPVTDRLLAVTDGKIRAIERTVLRMLNPDKARTIDEEHKEKSASWVHKIGLGEWAPLKLIIGGGAKKRPEEKKAVPVAKPPVAPSKEEVKSVAATKQKNIETEKEIKKAHESRRIMERLAKSAGKADLDKTESAVASPNMGPIVESPKIQATVPETVSIPLPVEEKSKSADNPTTEVAHNAAASPAEKNIDSDIKIDF